MARFFERSQPDSSDPKPAGGQPSRTASAAPSHGLSRADRRRRRRRASARRKAEGQSLSNERLESRIALSVNVAGYEDAIDFFAQAPNFQDEYGFRRAPHSPRHTVHGRAIVASDDGSDVYIRQVASVTQDLIVDTSSNFLNYKIIDDIDGRYQQLFVTNGTLRNEPNPLRPEAARPYDGETANNWRTEFQLTDCEIVEGTISGAIRYTQADGTVSEWTYTTGLVLTGPGFGTASLPNGYIRPTAVGLLDNPDDARGADTQQSTMFVDWSDRPNPYNDTRLDASYLTFDESGTGPRAGFTRNTPATEATIEREDLSLADSPLYQVVQVVMPEALSTLQDGVTERQSLGIIPGSYRGESGAITVTWSDGIARPLPAFRADVNGVLRFNTFLPAANSGYTGSIYKDSSWYFTPETFGSGSTAGLIDVRGTIRTDGILELEFRKWESLATDGNNFTDETGGQWTGFSYLNPEPLYAGPGRVVVQDVDYLTYTRDAEPNTATFFAGQTITREVTVDLLTPGSTVNVDSPINVDPQIQSWFNFVTPERRQLPDIDLRATNVNIRAEMTAPDRVSIGRSQVARERLSIPPDDVNPYLLSPSMPSLYDREAPEPPILPAGGFPEIRQAAAIVEVNPRGQVTGLVLLPGYEGYGYDPDNPPTVTIDPPRDAAGGGSSSGNISATARALVGRDGRLTGFVITNPGSGYPTTVGNRPLVEISAPIPQAAAFARVAEINAATGQVVEIDVLDPGYRYHAPPRVIVEPPDLTGFGVQATARAVLDPEGRVARIEVVDPGWGYSRRPIVTIAAPSPIAMAEQITVEAEVRGSIYELYVGDDFGTDAPRGTARLSANGSLSTQPADVQIQFIQPPPFGVRPQDVEQQVFLTDAAGNPFPANFSPVGVIISGPGIRQGTRVVAWNPVTSLATLPPLSVSAAINLPSRAELSARAASLYLEATTADVFLEGLVNVEKQSYLVHSPPSAAYLAPFTLTTRSAAAGIQSGQLEGEVIDITLGNDSSTPLVGSTAEHVVDLRTAIDSLRTRAGSSADNPQGPYPYRLTITEEDTLSVDAVAASSLPISISATQGIELTSGIDTDGDVSLNAQADDDVRTTLRVTAPIRTRFGKVTIGADTVEVRNSLEVTSAAIVDGQQDVVIEARGGNLVLQGNIYAPNDVALEQTDRVDDLQFVRIDAFQAVQPGDTVQRVGLTLPNGGQLPTTFNPTGLGIEAVDPIDQALIARGARISGWDPATRTATLPFLYPDSLSQFYSETPLVGGVGTNVAQVLASATPLLDGAGTEVARVAPNSAWIRDAQVGDTISFRDAFGGQLPNFSRISRVNTATGEVTLEFAIPFDAADIIFDQGTQWSRRVNEGFTLEFLDAAGASLGTATVVGIDRPAGRVNLTAPVPIGAVSIRVPPSIQPVAGGPGSQPIQIRLSSPVRSVTLGEIDANLARVVADGLSIIADGKVAIGTDVNQLRATAGTGFALSELNDITIPLLASAGLVSLEALGVDLGSKGQNPIALTASLIDVNELVVNTPNGSARIETNTDSRLLVGDAVTIAKLGDRAPGMLAAGDVTIRSQSGDVVLLDAPLAGGNARAVRVATSGPLPATATYLPGVPSLTPSMLSGAGSLNAVGDRFWGTDTNGRPIQLAVGDLVLVKEQPRQKPSDPGFGSPAVDHTRENGVYRVAALGGGTFGSQRWQLVRDAASDTSIDMPNGTLVRVAEGTFANQAFSITYDSILPTLVERVGTNQLQFPELFPNFDLLEVGGVVNGTGIAPNSFITAIDPVARVVTLDVVNPGLVFDSGLGSVAVAAASGDTLLLGAGFSQEDFGRLAVGQQVTGPGILDGSVITRIDPTAREIDLAKTLLGPAVVSAAGNVLTFDPRDTDPPFTQFTQLEEDQKVQLYDSEARLLGTWTIETIDQPNRQVTLDSPAAGAAVTARIWTPGAVAPVLSGTGNPATAQVPVGDVRPSSIVFRAADRLAGVRVGQLFRFVNAAGVPITAVPPQPVSSVTVRVALDGVTVEGDVTIGFNSLLTPAQLAAVRSAPGGAAVEFLAPDQVAFGVSAPRSVPVDWNSWTASNVFDGTVMLSGRFTEVDAVPGETVSTRITAIPPESVVVPTAEIDTGVATANLVVLPAPDFFASAVVGQMVQFLDEPGNNDGDNAFVPPLDPLTGGLLAGQNTTVATMTRILGAPSPVFANLVVGQTVQFLAAGNDAVLGTATVTSFTVATDTIELSGAIPAGTVALRRLNVATITALDPETGEISLSEPTPRNARQVRLLPNTAPLLRGVGTVDALVAPYSPLFLWAEAGHTAEILDPAGTEILASLPINALDPVTGRIGLAGVIPAGGGLLRLGNLTTIQPRASFFSLARPGDVVEFVDALGTVLPGTGRITRMEPGLGGVLLDVAVPPRTARLRLPNVATVGSNSQFFGFARTGAAVAFTDTARVPIPTGPGRTIAGLDSLTGTVRFNGSIPLTAAAVEVAVPPNIILVPNNSPFFDLAREGDEVQFADRAGTTVAGSAKIVSLNPTLGRIEIDAPSAPVGTEQIRILGGNVVTVAAGSDFFDRVVVGNRVRFLDAAGEELLFGGLQGEPIEATIASVGRILPDGTRDIRLTELPPAVFTPVLGGSGTDTAQVTRNAPWFRRAVVGDAVQFRNAAGESVGSGRIGALDAAAGTVTLAEGVTVPDGAVQIELVNQSFTQLRVFSSVITLPNFADFSELVVGLDVYGDNLILPIQNEVTSVEPAADGILVEITTQWGVASARPSANGTRITYELAASQRNRLAVGQAVTVSGLPRFNVEQARIVSTTSTSFTVETFGAIGSAVTGLGQVRIDFSDRAAAGDEVEFLNLNAAEEIAIDADGREVRLGTGEVLAIYPDLNGSGDGYVLVRLDDGAALAGDYVMRTLTRGFRITAVDPVARTVSTDLGPTGATENVSFGIAPSAQYPAASTIRLSPDFTNYERLFEGQRVFGAGIDEGAKIVAIDRVAGTVSLTPDSIGTDRGPIRVTQRGSLRSPYYPEKFDDWVELDFQFNDFVEIKAGQRAELRDTYGKLLGVATVTAVDPRYRTVGLENGSLNDIADEVHTIRFLPVTSVRFGVIDGVGSGISELLLEPVGLTPITVTARPVTTNIGSDLASRTTTFVASTDGRTNDVTGSLGKMLGLYQQNDTRTTQIDVAVLDVKPGALSGGEATWILRLDPLFTAYDRLRAVLAEGGAVSGTPRMFTPEARLIDVDEDRREVTLGGESLSELAIETPDRVTFVTLPTETPNPEQDQEFRFWQWMTGNVRLLQELPAITQTITIDGALVSNAYAGSAGPDIPAPALPANRLGPVVIDGQRIARDRDGQLVRVGTEINGFDIIDSDADGSKIARLAVGGFQQGSGIKLDGVSHVIVEGANIGRTTTDARTPNTRGITITGRYLEVAGKVAGNVLEITETDRVVLNTLAAGQRVRLLNASNMAFPGEFTVKSLDRTDYQIEFEEAVPAGVKLVEIAAATENSIVDTTVVGSLAVGVYVDAGAERTYVVGGSVGTATIDNQVGIFVAGETINPARPTAKETFIGANAIVPAQPFIQSAAFVAGSNEITLPASLFNTPLIGLGLFFDNPRIVPPLTQGDDLSQQPVIIGVDSVRRVALLSEAAAVTQSTAFKIGHVFERVNDGTGEFVTLKLPESIPLDDVYVGQRITGTGLAPRVQIVSIDRDTRTVRISEPFSEPGLGVLTITAPGATVVRGNRTGILLRGEDSRVTNTLVFENTRSGIDVVTPGQQIGSTAAFGTANAAGAIPLASWPVTVTLRSTSNTITLPRTFTGTAADISVGTPIYGPGIRSGTTVAAVVSSATTGRVTSVTLSSNPDLGTSSSAAATIGFGVRVGGVQQTVFVSEADRGNLFVGQDVHGKGLPEFSQIAAVRLVGAGDYIVISAPSTALDSPNFAALAGDVVFAERTLSSNRIYGNGEYGIIVRHQGSGDASKGRSGLPTRIFANYFGLTGETTEAAPNRISPIIYTYETTPAAARTKIVSGLGTAGLKVEANGDWIKSASIDQPVQFLSSSGAVLGSATITTLSPETGGLSLSAPAPTGAANIRKAAELPSRFKVSGRVSRVDIWGNKYGQASGRDVSPPRGGGLDPIPPGDPTI